MRILEHRIAPEEAERTVKSIALKEMRLSRGQFSSLKFSGGLSVNGESARSDRRLRPGDVLRVRLEDRGTLALSPCRAEVRIAYEDEDYFILDKAAPLPTLSSAHQTGPTLENALYTHLGCPRDFLFRPVNRLDKGTSGLMAAAKNAHAQQLLQRLLHTDAFVREYLAICQGDLPERSGVIDLPIGKAGEGVRRSVRPDGSRAVTHYQVEAQKNGLTLVRLRLETGRTHQIRVHMQAMGCPIVGDYLYGTAREDLPGRFALHACRIQFVQPLTGLPVRCESPLPGELARLLE